MHTNVVLAALVAMGIMQGDAGGLIEEFDASLPRTGFINLVMTPAELLGDDAAKNLNHILLADQKIEWRMYVPRSYDAATPPGVLVFISSIDWGGIPDEWTPVMDAHNLIWISPSQAGGTAPVQERIMKSIIAPRAAGFGYVINSERVYVAGFSDGGKVANLVQAADPVGFKGGIYICGALFWGDKTPAKLDLMRANRHVFVRGCFDPKEREVRGVYDEYRAAGFENVQLITVQTRRQRLPQPKHVEQAIRYLDGKAVEAPRE
jgi:hypothetical protein